MRRIPPQRSISQLASSATLYVFAMPGRFTALPPVDGLDRVAEALAGYAAIAWERGLVRPVDPRLAGWLVQGLADRAMYYAVVIDPQADVDRLADQLTTVECGGVLTRWDDIWLDRSTATELPARERESPNSKGRER